MNNEEKLKQAIDTCDMFVKNNASIQVISSDVSYNIGGVGGITFHQYDTSSIEYLLDKVKDDQMILKHLQKSDYSKEKSSMTYYNAMKEYKDKFNFMCDVVSAIADYIVLSSNDFHNKIECENYFKGKVCERNENRDKQD